MLVRFWEARVEPGRLEEASTWVRGTLFVRAANEPGFDSGEVFLSEEVVGDPVAGDQPPRVVLLTRWDAEPRDLDESLPVGGPIARAHGWYFHSVD
jgi:hypothetical protein